MKVYNAYILIMLAFNLLIWITPLLAMSNNPFVGPIYAAFKLICNQLSERSLCISSNLSINDCSSSSGYQFPVCSRCMAIYAAMLIGGLAMPFLWDKDSRQTPNVWILILAAIPIGIDGLTQLFGFRESTNEIRIITGTIIGFVIPFFLIPLVNDLIYILSKKTNNTRK